MKNINLFSELNNNYMTTEKLITKLVPHITKDGVYAMCGGMDEEHREKTYNKMRAYKSRILSGERKEKTLREVFALFGYVQVTTIWEKEELDTKPSKAL